MKNVFIKICLSLVFLFSLSTQAMATWTVKATTHTESTNGTAPTTSAIDTTGADTIILGITGIAACPTTTPHDNKNSNTVWQLLKRETTSDSVIIDIWEATGSFSGSTISVGTGHTFTALSNSCGNTLNAIFVLALDTSSSTDGANQDKTTTATTGGSTSLATTALTPTNANSIVITAIVLDDAISSLTPNFVETGYTLIGPEYANGNTEPGAMAYKIQTAATSTAPTWGWATSARAAAVNVSLDNTLPVCGGSSPNLTAGLWSDVPKCYTGATSGTDIITVASGTYSVTSGLVWSKGVNLRCGGTCTVTDNTSGTSPLIDFTESVDSSIRLTGFNIINGTGVQHTTNSGGTIQINHIANGKMIIIQGNSFTFTNAVSDINYIMIGSHQGLITGNTATGVLTASACDNQQAFVRQVVGTTDGAWTSVAYFGNADTDGTKNLYIENNTIVDLLQAIDVDDNGRTVIRFNTFINAAAGLHGDTSRPGARWADVYNNTFSYVDASPHTDTCSGGQSPNVNHYLSARAGTMLIHANTLPQLFNKDDIAFFVWELRRNQTAAGLNCWGAGGTAAAAYRVAHPGTIADLGSSNYPAGYQVGWGWTSGGTQFGALGTYGDLEPIYLFSNTSDGNYTNTKKPSIEDFDNNSDVSCHSVYGSAVDPSPSSPPGYGYETVTDYVHFDREVYPQAGSGTNTVQTNATTPFNGSTGTGFGTRVSPNYRPTTCTTGTVYWATDVGSWNTSGSGGQGVLDKCTSTDTWTNAWYVPYNYPHPLTSIGPDTTAPVPGNSGTVTVTGSGATRSVSWTAATDDVDSPSLLKYAVVQSLANNIDTIAHAKQRGVIVVPYTTNITSAAISQLATSSTYYFNILVKDTSGNENIYRTDSTPVTDTTPPTPGSTGTITTSSVGSTSMTLSWTAATDAGFAASQLEYEVVMSTSNNVDTLKHCQTNGIVIKPFAAAYTSVNVTGLSSSTSYYFNIVVRDPNFNTAVYTAKNQSTTSF